jgi:hypothetical protein
MNWILTHLEGTEYIAGERDHGVFTKIHGKIDHQEDGFHWAAFRGRKVIVGECKTFGEATTAVERALESNNLNQ